MKKHQILLILAGLLLLILWVVPMWKINLQAPQYPDGVEMHIHINKIGGSEPGTLQNINILNHYVGMKEIKPESIPELKIFPWVIMGFIALAIICALINKRWSFIFWPLLYLAAIIFGMYDFYLWEFDYGHNLDPNAIMKFDVDSYQPPLIGTKKLLNFTASSYPHWGGWAMIVSLALAVWAAVVKFKRTKHGA